MDYCNSMLGIDSQDKEKGTVFTQPHLVDGKHRQRSCHGSRSWSHAAETMTMFV